MATFWTCQRVSAGERCATRNPGRLQKCSRCGGRRRARRRPAHLAALELSYAQYVALNGGDHCGICGRPREGRRLDRDHCHATGVPRGLLCHLCNRALAAHVTVEWLRAALLYLERSGS